MRSFFFITAILLSTAMFAQKDTALPPYQRYPGVPGLQLLALDSTQYTKDKLPTNKPLLLLLFSPDCEHCQHKAEQIKANPEAFANTHILMVSTYPLQRIQSFATTYGLEQMENVTLAKDPYYVLVSFYSIRMLPYAALYTRKGKLIRTFEGNVAIERIVAAFNEAR